MTGAVREAECKLHAEGCSDRDECSGPAGRSECRVLRLQSMHAANPATVLSHEKPQSLACKGALSTWFEGLGGGRKRILDLRAQSRLGQKLCDFVVGCPLRQHEAIVASRRPGCRARVEPAGAAPLGCQNRGFRNLFINDEVGETCSEKDSLFCGALCPLLMKRVAAPQPSSSRDGTGDHEAKGQ